MDRGCSGRQCGVSQAGRQHRKQSEKSKWAIQALRYKYRGKILLYRSIIENIYLIYISTCSAGRFGIFYEATFVKPESSIKRS